MCRLVAVIARSSIGKSVDDGVVALANFIASPRETRKTIRQAKEGRSQGTRPTASKLKRGPRGPFFICRMGALEERPPGSNRARLGRATDARSAPRMDEERSDESIPPSPPEKPKAPNRGLLFFSPSMVEDENPDRPTQRLQVASDPISSKSTARWCQGCPELRHP